MHHIDRLGLNTGIYLYHARRWTLLALVPALLLSSLVFVYVGEQQKTYAATAVLYVQQTQTSLAGGTGNVDVFGSEQLATSYAAMIGDETIASEANRLLAKKYPGYQVSYTSAQTTQKLAQQSTQLFSVTASDILRLRAVDGANTVAKVFIHRIRRLDRQRFAQDEQRIQQEANQAQAKVAATAARIVSYHGSNAGLSALKTELGAYTSSYSTLITSLNNFRATRDASLANISLFSTATHASQTGPHPTRIALIAAIVLMVLASGLIYGYEYVNDLPRNPVEVETAAGAPVLGTVQSYSTGHSVAKLIVESSPHSSCAEAYRVVRTNLLFTDVDHPARSLLVTSALPAEGKSTTVGNLAQAFAELGGPVVIIDADLRHPSQHRLFPTEEASTGGLTTLLLSVQEGISAEVAGRATGIPNLALISSGPVPANPSNLLGSTRMRAMLARCAGESSITLVDSPPVLAVADAAILATMVDGVILVVDPQSTKRRDIARAREAITAVGGQIVGVVMNRLRPRGPMSTYYYAAYAYESAQTKANVRADLAGAPQPSTPTATTPGLQPWSRD